MTIKRIAKTLHQMIGDKQTVDTIIALARLRSDGGKRSVIREIKKEAHARGYRINHVPPILST